MKTRREVAYPCNGGEFVRFRWFGEKGDNGDNGGSGEGTGPENGAVMRASEGSGGRLEAMPANS